MLQNLIPEKSRRQSIYYPWSTLQRDDDDEEEWNDEEDLSDVGEDFDLDPTNHSDDEDPMEDVDLAPEVHDDDWDQPGTSGTQKLHAD